ncbi:MAG: phosphatidate cytidylyltransferase [Phycisphaerae bacterium]
MTVPSLEGPAKHGHVPPPDDNNANSLGRHTTVWRIGYGALAIAVVLAIFVSDAVVAKEAASGAGPMADLLRQGSIVPIVTATLFVIGALEMSRLSQRRGVHPHVWFACIMIAAMILAPWFSAAGWLGQGVNEVEGIYWQVVLLMVATMGAGVLTVVRYKPARALRDMNATLVMIVFLGFLGSFGVQLRCARDTPAEDGAWLLLIVVLVTKASDIGGYAIGSAFGRHKLTPAISPGKSIEGAVGGMLVSALVAVGFATAGSAAMGLTSGGYPVDVLGPEKPAFSLLDEITRTLSLTQAHSTLHPTARAFILGIALSAAGQFGDLLESCFKRDAEVKDSGAVIPHFGGILDLLDSLVLAMPVGWFLLTAVWGVA